MSNNDAACWDAFGSDTDDSDDDYAQSSTNNHEHEVELAAESVSMAATKHFAQLIKTSGVPVKERVVAISNDSATEWGEILQRKLADREFTSVIVSEKPESKLLSDAAVVYLTNKEKDCDNLFIESCTRKSVIPGGVLWVVTSQDCPSLLLENLSAQVWDIGSAITTQPSPTYTITKIQKRACTINIWSCPWMDKHSVIPEHIASNETGLDIRTNETYIEYEQRVVSELTICPSVAERTSNKTPKHFTGESSSTTVLESAHVEQAVKILRRHGFVIIKGLLPPDQTLPYGEALLADFQSAIACLKGNKKRPVNMLIPHQVNEGRTTQIFEPLSYREMSMREDLRVDLRSGPSLKRLADSHSSKFNLQDSQSSHMTPVTIDSSTIGSLEHFRFHPSLISILKALFNPVDDTLSRGNFGRWNFGNSGPDGTPQPFRIGPIGAVISCPGSGDQAIHADTPHLFEHINCLPCHYCNIFTPGFEIISDEENHGYFKHEFDSDGVWTGNTTMGGTALVNGSHKLNVTAKLLGEEDSVDSSESMKRRQLLQLQTIRPALDVGDVLIFDNRCLHYGLANNSAGDKTGANVNAGRRPMLYLNVTQGWFHDPKNWDDRESIFDNDDENDEE